MPDGPFYRPFLEKHCQIRPNLFSLRARQKLTHFFQNFNRFFAIFVEEKIPERSNQSLREPLIGARSIFSVDVVFQR